MEVICLCSSLIQHDKLLAHSFPWHYAQTSSQFIMQWWDRRRCDKTSVFPPPCGYHFWTRNDINTQNKDFKLPHWCQINNQPTWRHSNKQGHDLSSSFLLYSYFYKDEHLFKGYVIPVLQDDTISLSLYDYFNSNPMGFCSNTYGCSECYYLQIISADLVKEFMQITLTPTLEERLQFLAWQLTRENTANQNWTSTP